MVLMKTQSMQDQVLPPFVDLSPEFVAPSPEFVAFSPEFVDLSAGCFDLSHLVAVGVVGLSVGVFHL